MSRHFNVQHYLQKELIRHAINEMQTCHYTAKPGSLCCSSKHQMLPTVHLTTLCLVYICSLTHTALASSSPVNTIAVCFIYNQHATFIDQTLPSIPHYDANYSTSSNTTKNSQPMKLQLLLVAHVWHFSINCKNYFKTTIFNTDITVYFGKFFHCTTAQRW